MHFLNKTEEQKRLLRHWFAIYTRPKFEKKIDSELKKKGISSYLPLHTVCKVWSDRIKKIQEPLFPSYVFVYGNSVERYRALQTTGAVRMVSFNGQPVRIPSEQIDGIKKVLEHGYNPEPFQYFAVGDEVEVLYGPLKGLRGLFVEDRGKGRLAISIHGIQQSFAIEVERNKVKRISSVSLAV